jgi:DNA-binding PadR family transcriptional regulator
VLRWAILTLLADQDSSGYDLSKSFDASVAYVWAAGQSQIYPELRRLEDEGLIRGRDVAQRGRPDKRLFHLTARGRRALVEWAASPLPPLAVRDAFQLRTVNLGRLPPARARELLTDQRDLLDQRLAILGSIHEILTGSDELGSGPNVGWRLSVEAGLRVHRAYRDWCDWAVTQLDG